jgi:uncharacterized membrane protein YagU involved in acid resistance
MLCLPHNSIGTFSALETRNSFAGNPTSGLKTSATAFKASPLHGRCLYFLPAAQSLRKNFLFIRQESFMNEINTANIVKGALAGLIGGLVASFVMEQFQSLIMSASPSEEKHQDQNEEPSNEKAAIAISENVFDHHLTKEEKSVAGEAMHYAMGGTSGIILGAVSELVPEAAAGAGLPFGTAVWLVADDFIVPALGLSKPASDVPLSQHAYALSSHLVYGLTTDMVRRGIRHLL